MNHNNPNTIQGAGLGLRRAIIGPLSEQKPSQIDFMEVAPENWINLGGRFGKQFRAMTEAYPFVTHGLSLSLGGPEPIDVELVKSIKRFLDEHKISVYTEHLSYCSDDGHLYDLMPIPFTSDAVDHVVKRIHQVQDILERPMGIENVSYYAAPGQELSEIEFLKAVLEQADCGLLLDINNIYVNSVNHGYDPEAFLSQMPGERIQYIHVAGHYNEADDLIVDTHGANVIDPVWELLSKAYQLFGVKPTLLERDFNIPEVPELLNEVGIIRDMQARYRLPDEQFA
ncbi:HvfB family MNIO-type RiPP peptide maturase [Ketobacter alkanivorans]|uniref:UPF0276 protein Kalk_20595 n=1 Tax=Ketobacter alkanivorans TaxID=1917421 RepID=A0A2K9LRB4_9GAMM|nr:DUF692 domain-containing protein [Ketobacter alkanivorans]AUM14681.1 hypothetical protein Kalk_20595 [Ketobacter alkanivorans]